MLTLNKAPIHPLFVALGASAFALGCAGMFQSTSSSSSSSSSEGHTGAVTFVNQSSARICRLEGHRGDDFNYVVDLGTGDSFEIPAGDDYLDLTATECGGQNTVFGTRGSVGDPGPDYISRLEHGRVVLYDTMPASSSGEHAFDVNRISMADWIPYGRDWQDASLARQGLDIVRDHASRSGWSEDFRFAVMMGREWGTVRNEWSGVITSRVAGVAVAARWADGHCTIQEFGLMQEHDGFNFSGSIRFNGVGPQWSLPCDAISYATSVPGVASLDGSSPAPTRSTATPAPAGGRCDNTCSTAFDNECDDGGPNSLYSVCALGTDCNDCGPR